MQSMSTLLVTLLFLITSSVKIAQASGDRTFTIYNGCHETIWVGALGNFIPNHGGWQLDPGKTSTATVPGNWSGRFWGRTGCHFNSKGVGTCSTGDCGGVEQCSGAGGNPPASLAEFTLGGETSSDFYDVSLVDGYNLPMQIEPVANSTIGGKPVAGLPIDPNDPYSCGAPSCVSDLNATCPADLQQKDPSGKVVACLSACEKFNTDQFCCRGAFGTPDKCPATNYSEIFKTACPGAYSYAYDDKTSTYTCHQTNYVITFCPTGQGNPPELGPKPDPSTSPTPPTPKPVPATPPKPTLPAQDFSYSIQITSDHHVQFSFMPSIPAEFVVIHYIINNSTQQNIQMQIQSNGVWQWVSREIIQPGDQIQVSFTYRMVGQPDHDSQWSTDLAGITPNITH